MENSTVIIDRSWFYHPNYSALRLLSIIGPPIWEWHFYQFNISSAAWDYNIHNPDYLYCALQQKRVYPLCKGLLLDAQSLRFQLSNPTILKVRGPRRMQFSFWWSIWSFSDCSITGSVTLWLSRLHRGRQKLTGAPNPTQQQMGIFTSHKFESLPGSPVTEYILN